VVVNLADHPEFNLNNPLELKRQLLKFLSNTTTKKPMTRKSVSSNCGCPAAEESEGGGCFGNCLSSYGVSWVEIILCGAACAAAGTGGGAIICAVCVGVNVTLVEFCALRCNMYAARLRDSAVPIRNLNALRSARVSRKTRLITSAASVG
jgi:hypothetical protein